MQDPSTRYLRTAILIILIEAQEPDRYPQSNKIQLNKKPRCNMLHERYIRPPNLAIDADVKKIYCSLRYSDIDRAESTLDN
jgi:hypothetical protein